jgi:arylsulfatase
MAPKGTVEKYEKIYSASWEQLREQRFEKQKQLGIWPLNMTIPKRLPPNVPWDSLGPIQKEYASRIMAVHAAMIENTDQNIGRLINYLKQIGKYDNTLIVFTSDNAGSEPIQFPLAAALSNKIDHKALLAFLNNVNNTLSNLGNSTSSINYGAWGSYVSVAPLSGFKISEYEGGIRPPFIIKEPSTSTSASYSKISAINATTPGSHTTDKNHVIRSFVFVTDLTPTFLDYAKVSHPTTYDGHAVYPMMGKSMKTLLEGKADRVHDINETISSELFNNSAVFMGDWAAIWDQSHPTGKWQLYNIAKDPGENKNVADQYPALVQKMASAYEKYSKDVGIVIPRGSVFAFQASHIYPPPDRPQTIYLFAIQPPELKIVKELLTNGTFVSED